MVTENAPFRIIHRRHAEHNEEGLVARFENHWRKLERRRAKGEGKPPPSHLDFRVTQRSQRRARAIIKAQLDACGLGHLYPADVKQIDSLLRHQGRCEAYISEATADEIAADLHQEFPWLAAASEEVWHMLRRCARRGEAATLGPLLLNGPVGIGKSYWSKSLSGRLKVPYVGVNASAGEGQFAISGMERGWQGAQPGRVVESFCEHRVANPIVFIDEVDKGGQMVSDRGRNYSADNALLSMTERSDAKSWTCPYFRVEFDLSKVSWVMASNSLDAVSKPLQSRARVVELSHITLQQMVSFAEREIDRRKLDDAAGGSVIDAIRQFSSQNRRPLNLRDVGRLLSRAEVWSGRPILQ